MHAGYVEGGKEASNTNITENFFKILVNPEVEML